jgi:DNA-binding transcriptional ArsR family regulator
LDSITKANLKKRAGILKALAHPTRLFILQKLSEREHCVCELRDLVKADLSTVSKHLSLMKSAGIVEDEKRGSQVFYTLKFPCVLNFFSCIDAVLTSDNESAPR